MSLLTATDLAVEFRSSTRVVRAVNGVSITIEPSEALAIVGESGSGKSVTSLALTRLLPRNATITAGTVVLDGRPILTLSDEELRDIRGRKVGMVFQDPLTSLNPVLTIGAQLTEGLRAHQQVSQSAADDRAISLLTRVGIPEARQRMSVYPHQLSGGMRQRVMIAAALMLGPKLLIADEPTTALDVTIQAQVLEVIKEVTAESGTAVLLITHDLGVVADMTDRVAVMYAGRIVEQGTTDEIFGRPRHPYTVGLLASVTRLDRDKGADLRPIEGSPPDASRLPPGCPFQPRCRWRLDRCATEVPPLVIDVPGAAGPQGVEPGVEAADGAAGPTAHRVACFRPVTPEEAVIGMPLPMAGTAPA